MAQIFRDYRRTVGARLNHRDQVMIRPVGDARPAPFAKTQHRFAGLSFTVNGAVAMLSDYDRKSKHRRTFMIDPTHPDSDRKLLWDLSINERYNDPGTPLLRPLPLCGTSVSA